MIWAFLLKNWKFTLMGLLIIGIVSMYGILNLRISYLQIEVKNLKADMKFCVDANTTGLATIQSLQAELKASNKICDSRLKTKDKVIDNLRKIDSLKGEKIEGSGDSVLDALNRMFSDN